MRRRDFKKKLKERPTSASYEVGYRKPPVKTRFRPGQSGNPGGRPRGAKKKSADLSFNEQRLKSIIREEAYRTINVNDASGQVSMPIARAVVRSLAVNAAKGNPRAQRLFTELLSTIENDDKSLHDEFLQTAIKYKTDWEIELDRRERLGITDAPLPLPHPDHVVIDMATGTVRILGPITREEQEQWEMWRGRMQQLDREIAALERELNSDPNHPDREMILEAIAQDRKARAIIAKLFAD